MISFEFAEPPHIITNDQFYAINELVNEFGWMLDYDVVQGDFHEEHGDVVYLWVHHKDGQRPTRHHIAVDGEVFLHEDVDWDWKGTGA